MKILKYKKFAHIRIFFSCFIYIYIYTRPLSIGANTGSTGAATCSNAADLGSTGTSKHFNVGALHLKFLL